MIHHLCHTRTFYAYFASVFGAICRQSCIRVPNMLKHFFKTMVHWSRRYLGIFGIFVDSMFPTTLDPPTLVTQLVQWKKKMKQNPDGFFLQQYLFFLATVTGGFALMLAKVDALRPQLEPFLLPYKDGAWVISTNQLLQFHWRLYRLPCRILVSWCEVTPKGSLVVFNNTVSSRNMGIHFRNLELGANMIKISSKAKW